MSRRKGDTDIVLKPDKEEMESALSSLREELNYRLLCEMFTSEWSHERMLWVESISMTAYEQKQSRAESKEITSVWRRIRNYFRKRKAR